MPLGLYGPVIFGVSGGKVTTFDDLTRSVSARWEEHEIFRAKPQLEYGGPKLVEVSFKMCFISPITGSPLAGITTLEEIMDLHMVLPLVIGMKPMGRGASLFVMTDLETSPKFFYRNGGIIGATATVKLKEYADNILGTLASALGGLFSGSSSLPGAGAAVSGAAGADVAGAAVPASMTSAETSGYASSAAAAVDTGSGYGSSFGAVGPQGSGSVTVGELIQTS